MFKGCLVFVVVGVNDSIYIFGGYMVDENYNEISMLDVYKYVFVIGEYKLLMFMFVFVDDVIVLVY